jgi:hypothetical protein
MSTELIYIAPLWEVRRLGCGWYQGETPLWPAPTQRTQDPHEALRWIERQVEQHLAGCGWVRNSLNTTAAPGQGQI